MFCCSPNIHGEHGTAFQNPELKSVVEQWEIKKSYVLMADSLAEKLLT